MQYKWTVLTVTTIGIFMATLDSSVVVVGLPTVIESLGTTLAAGIWVITSYRLMITVLLVTIGRLADMIGRVRLYNAGFAVFTIGSALCTLATSGSALVVFRAIQGIGAALLFVNSMAIVTDAFPPEELGTGIGINQVAINAGTIVGYTLSGVMISLFGWRSLFAINLPIGTFGTYWAHRRLKEIPHENRGEKFDFTGAAVFSTALTILLLAMTVSDIRAITTQLAILVSALIFAAFLWIERRVEFPVIDMRLFKIRAFGFGNFTNLLNNLTFQSLAFSMSLYFQLVKGFSPLQAGIALIPLDATLILVGPVSGRLSDRFGARGLSTIGLAACGLSFMMLRSLDLSTPQIVIAEELMLMGFGLGLFRSPNASSVMASVPPQQRGVAAGIRSTILNASTVASIPFAMVIMSLIIPYDALSTIIGGGSTNPAELVLFMDAIKSAFLVFSALNFAAAVLSPLRGGGINRLDGAKSRGPEKWGRPEALPRR